MVLPEAFDIEFYKNKYDDLTDFDDEKIVHHYRKIGKYENREYCDLPDNWDWEKHQQNFSNDIFTKEEAITHYSIHKNYLGVDTIQELTTDKEPIYIVYFICINPEKNWGDFIQGQIGDMLRCKILDRAKLFVVISGKEAEIKQVEILISGMVQKQVDYTHIFTNEFEFPAIEKISQLAKEFPEKIYIYLHTKGMFFNHPHTWRSVMNRKLTMNLFLDWDNTLSIFKRCPNIKKAGLFPSLGGWIWFNFWWARGEYLANCKPLEKNDDRFSCELWLGDHGSKTWTDCYSLYYKSICYHQIPSIMPKILYVDMDPPDIIPLRF